MTLNFKRQIATLHRFSVIKHANSCSERPDASGLGAVHLAGDLNMQTPVLIVTKNNALANVETLKKADPPSPDDVNSTAISGSLITII